MTFVDGQTLSALQLNEAFAQTESSANRQIALSSLSTDNQYPSAKATYDFVNSALSNLKTTVLTAAEAIAEGDFINIYLVGGVPRIRRATAADPTAFAVGFTQTAIAINATGRISFDGFNSHVSVGSTVSEVWLSDVVPGSFLSTPPTATGSIVQSLGISIASVGILFSLQQRTLL